MGLDNPTHILLLFVLVLLVFGAKRLPEIGRSLGSGLREFKHSVSGESHTPEPQQTLPPPPVQVQQPPQQPVAQQQAAPQAQDAFAQREPTGSDRG